MEGGNSCVNNFVVGAIIGAKNGVNHIALSAPVGLCRKLDERVVTHPKPSSS